MNNDIKDYREKHKNCKWCSHHSYKNKLEWSWEECELNEKRCEHFKWIKAKLCKYYKVEENDK